MSPDSVCAIVVSYHPPPSTLPTIAAIAMQTNHVVVVDNGSSDVELAPLRSLAQGNGVTLIELGDNFGIAEALNRGVRWALENRYPWVLLFDQDSQITTGYVGTMLEAWRAHPASHRLGSLHPTYIDPDHRGPVFILRAEDEGPVRSMTSGSLLPAATFEKLGFFASEYFIDEVDVEFCFRIRANGLLIADSPLATLVHHAGNPVEASFLGFHFHSLNHTSARRYYMTRNRLVVYRTYFAVFPKWVISCAFEAFKETLKSFLGEQNRGRKFRNLCLGVVDAFAGRMGRRDDLS